MDIVENLVRKGAEINASTYDGITAVITAAVNGRTEMIEVLHSLGARLNARAKNRYSARFFAIANANFEADEVLVKLGAEKLTIQEQLKILWPKIVGIVFFPFMYRRMKRTLLTNLIVASMHDDLTNAKKWHSLGAPINGIGIDGNTPLIVAVKNGHLSMVEFLIEQGADIGQSNLAGETALSIAGETGDSHLIALLEKYVEGSKD